MTTAKPKVSVLTTCYNREEFLSECIESILLSSFQDFELILVDDCSSDSTWDIIQNYASRDNRIIAHKNEINIGDYPNRNKAASLANGTYLKYVDADDVISRHFLEILVHSMEQFPQAGLGLFGGPTWAKPQYLNPKAAIRGYYRNEHTCFNRSPLMSIIKRTAFEEIGGFKEASQTGDFELWHRLTAHSGLVLMPSLAWVRTHPNQQSEEARLDPSVYFRYLIVSLQFLEDYTIENNTDHQLVQAKRKHIARTILYSIKKHGFRTSNKFRLIANWNWAKTIKEAL